MSQIYMNCMPKNLMWKWATETNLDQPTTSRKKKKKKTSRKFTKDGSWDLKRSLCNDQSKKHAKETIWFSICFWNGHILNLTYLHCNDVIMSVKHLKSPSSQLFTKPFVQVQIKENSSTSLVFVRAIHQWPVNSKHQRPVTRKKFSFLDAIMWVRSRNCGCLFTWFCYQLIAKPGNKTATVPWPDPCKLYKKATYSCTQNTLNWLRLNLCINKRNTR